MAIDRAEQHRSGDPSIIQDKGQTTPLGSISNFKVKTDGDLLGVTVSFVVVSLTNIGNIVLKRSSTGSLKDAVAVTTLTRALGAASYDDRSSLAVGKQNSYWIEVTTTDGAITTDFGPQVGDITPGTAIPATPVTFLDVSQSPNADGLSVTLTIAIEVTAAVQFSGMQVTLSNYVGSGLTSYVAYSRAKQFTLVVNKTGINHTIQEFIHNAAFTYQVTDIVNKVVTLDGVATVPVRPINVKAVGGSDMTQITCDVSADPSVSSYNLYISLGGVGTQFLVKSAIKGQSDVIVFQDIGQGFLGQWGWFVTAVNALGESVKSGPFTPAQLFA